MPMITSDTLPLDERYRFLGWTQNENLLVVSSE
jgi:hypothetical protein